MAHSNAPVPDDSQMVLVSLDGDPEEVAEAFIRDSLPDVFLSEIDLSTPAGMLQLLTQLPGRYYKAAVEVDELVAFVDRNRAVLGDGTLLEGIARVAEEQADEELTPWLVGLVEQMRRVLDGRPDDVDVVSSKLLWLCVALDSQLHAGQITFAEAQDVLARPHNARRMSRAAVGYLFRDYVANMDELDSPRTDYVMVITECALMSGLLDWQALGARLLGGLPPPDDATAWIAQRRRLRTSLQRAGRWDDALEESLARASTRFGRPVDDDDL